MSEQNEVPMIYTSKGNLPIDSLQNEVIWNFSATSIEFSEIHRHNGEVVKQSAHIYKLPEGTEFNLSGGNLGGGPING